MAGCFINYRTGDGEHIAALLDRDLSRRFGEHEVFLASKSIEAGEDFTRALVDAVRRCDVLIAVIGPEWTRVPGPGGTAPAFSDPADWTRREIAMALDAGTPVIPVLFGDAPRLRAADLPEDIQGLARCQYRRYHHRTSQSGLDDIADAIAIAVPRLEEGAGPAQEPRPEDIGNTMRDVGGTGVQVRDIGDGGTLIAGNSGPVAGRDSYSGSTVHHGSGDQILGTQYRSTRREERR
ncbi:toll/interleukin-1 receptor domain-containing protein [Nocardiopsis sp. NPDC057823]|uniref:toll/interleukin-1 receptor domain-containing protein n=1 Tax=Nocardiopsis sp. NPDC057823 TaxID=3346256 RepID=UPI0036728161